MAQAPAPALMLRDGDEEELRRLVRSSTARAGLVQRARIVLLASEGVGNGVSLGPRGLLEHVGTRTHVDR